MAMPLKWEFPGGKIEIGESKKDCIKREIKEELGLTVEINHELPIVNHDYDDFSILLYPFICHPIGGVLHANGHTQAIWVEKNDLLDYEWAAANIPIVKYYLQLLNEN